MSDGAEALFAQWVEHHVLRGEALDPGLLCAERPQWLPDLQALIARYLEVSGSLDGLSRGAGRAPAPPAAGTPPLPAFEGFRTIERIGTGGMGEVYKLHDLKLDRLVAAKVLRSDCRRATGLAGFLAEARAMALFQDRRIVQIHELRDEAEPPVLIMEYVDGFELGRLAPSLEFPQRARIMREVCEAVQHAHDVGVQHRDLKPSNIMLDAELRPKILDFGLSSGDPARGHFRGTPRYLAPEQLDASQPIDGRTDVYALGAVLYELLTGVPPVGGMSEDEIVANVRAGAIRLPVELAPGTPEPLQAIALKALEARPEDRYQSARDMALDLARFLDGRPVTTRPSRYASVLTARIRPHLDQIEDWLRLKLIHPHEAGRIRSAYRALERRDDDWIGESRVLSYSQIALYLGAFLLMCGSLYYFGARRFHLNLKGVLQPFAVLAVPFAGLNLAAHMLERRGHKAVAVAFYLGGVSLLPLFLLIAFHDQGLWVRPPDTPGQLFLDGSVSNTQLQVTILAACVWAAWLAWRTRTIALSTVLAVLVLLLTLAVLSDFGLRTWLDQQQWDRLALHLLPLVPIFVAAGLGLEHAGAPWFGRPLYTGAAVLLFVTLGLLALNGRLFHYLGLTLAPFQAASVSDPTLLDTVAALSLNGVAFYLVGVLADARGTALMKPAAWLLFTVSPFAVLEPLAFLSRTAEYSRAFDWTYLGLAVAMALLSHQRQRKSFYYAGLVNIGVALWLITTHYEWFDRPSWAILLIAVGLAGLLAGFGLDWRERRGMRPGS
jgi:serine/threonine protein kinase